MHTFSVIPKNELLFYHGEITVQRIIEFGTKQWPQIQPDEIVVATNQAIGSSGTYVMRIKASQKYFDRVGEGN